MNYYLINLKQWNGIFFYKILIFFVNKSRKTAISQLNSVDKVGIGQQRNEFWAEKKIMRFKQKAGYTLVLQYFVINEKKINQIDLSQNVIICNILPFEM